MGKVTLLKDQFPSLKSQLDDDEKAVPLNDSDFYSELKHRGYTHAGVHRMIRSLSFTDRGKFKCRFFRGVWKIDRIIGEKA